MMKLTTQKKQILPSGNNLCKIMVLYINIYFESSNDNKTNLGEKPSLQNILLHLKHPTCQHDQSCVAAAAKVT